MVGDSCVPIRWHSKQAEGVVDFWCTGMLDLAGAALKNRITMTIAKTNPMILTIIMSVRALASSVGIIHS